MHRTSGPIRNSGPGQNPGWFYVAIDPQLADYYRWLFRPLKLSCPAFYPCLNGPHVTFIAGDREPRLVSTQEMSGFLETEVRVDYDNVMYTNGRAFWLNCRCPALDNIRRQLDLPPRNGYHITLGNVKNAR